MLVEGNMLSKDAVVAMREKHPNYMPFNRYFDEEGVGEGFGGGKGFVDVTNPVKRIEGSSRNVIDPFESIVKNTFKSMQAIERNKVGLALADLAENEGAGNGLKSLPVMEKSLWQKKISLLCSVMVKKNSINLRRSCIVP